MSWGPTSLIRAVSEAAVATDGPAAKAATVMLAMSYRELNAGGSRRGLTLFSAPPV
jgi:hypothetical protein